MKNDVSNCETPYPHDVSYKSLFNQKYSLGGDVVLEKYNRMAVVGFILDILERNDFI